MQENTIVFYYVSVNDHASHRMSVARGKNDCVKSSSCCCSLLCPIYIMASHGNCIFGAPSLLLYNQRVPSDHIICR